MDSTRCPCGDIDEVKRLGCPNWLTDAAMWMVGESRQDEDNRKRNLIPCGNGDETNITVLNEKSSIPGEDEERSSRYRGGGVFKKRQLTPKGPLQFLKL